jgi:MFS transporter, SHS family, lactate transporter
MSVSAYLQKNHIFRRPKPESHTRPLLKVVASLTWVQWAHYWSGWLAWTCDAVDFFSVSLSVPQLSVQFSRPTHDITTAITLTLLLRTAGAIIFGIFSDRYGRKWPLCVNLVLVAGLELGAGFVQTFHQFLAVRSLFGIGMGGIWGMSISTALENLPVEARGIASGFIQQGYAVGYIFAAVINLRLVPEVQPHWRALFWTAAGMSLFAAFVRSVLPESAFFLRVREGENRQTSGEKTKIFIREMIAMLKSHWLVALYMFFLMGGACV